jgi:hypothetical protein
MPFAQRPAAGLDDMGRRIEVGFADLEVDDLTPLCLQSLRFSQDRKSRLCPQTLHPPRQFHTFLRSIETRHFPAITPQQSSMERSAFAKAMGLIQARSWRVPLLPTFCAAVTDM